MQGKTGTGQDNWEKSMFSKQMDPAINNTLSSLVYTIHNWTTKQIFWSKIVIWRSQSMNNKLFAICHLMYNESIVSILQQIFPLSSVQKLSYCRNSDEMLDKKQFR